METTIVRNRERLQILTPTGFSDFTGISRKLVSEYVEILFDDGVVLKCTDNHRIKINDDFIEAKNLNDVRKKIIKKNVFVYDPIDVSDGNEYLVENIINHNCVEFMGSSGTLISGWKLKELVHQTPIYEKDGLAMYVSPNKARSYVCIVDSSKGKGLDYSAFSIIDVTVMPYVQVCAYKNNTITPLDYAEVVHRVAKSYNAASVLVEVNNMGEQVAHALHMDFEYDNMLFTENAGREGKRITSGFGSNIEKGINTTKNVKATGCSILKLLIEQNQLIINDFSTIQELSTFSKKGVSYEAEPGNHDDMVMGLVLFAWLSDQMYFKEYTNIHTLMKLREKTDEDIAEDLTPFGFIFDGIDQDDYVTHTPSNSWIAENEFI
jgi:hypothetical protein